MSSRNTERQPVFEFIRVFVHVLNMTDGSAPMLTNFDGKSPMSAAANITDLTREMASALVEREEQQSGSRMQAYRAVAKEIGTSASWIRKFVSGSPEVKEPGWSVGWQIVDAYGRLCSWIETEMELKKQRALALRGRFDAITPSNSRLDQMAAGSSAARKAQPESFCPTTIVSPRVPHEPERGA